jgi:hypothetical protein
MLLSFATLFILQFYHVFSFLSYKLSTRPRVLKKVYVDVLFLSKGRRRFCRINVKLLFIFQNCKKFINKHTEY